MSAEVTGAGVMKFLAGTAGGGAVVYTVAAAVGEVPIPEGHTVMDVAVMAMGVYLVTLIYRLNKTDKEPATPAPSTIPPKEASGEARSPINEFLLQHLERISFGIDKNQVSLNEFHGDFREFRGEMHARVGALERKIDKKNMGEIPRP